MIKTPSKPIAQYTRPFIFRLAEKLFPTIDKECALEWTPTIFQKWIRKTIFKEDIRDNNWSHFKNQTVDIVYVIGEINGESKRYRVLNFIEFLKNKSHTALFIYPFEIKKLIRKNISPKTIIFFRVPWSKDSEKLIHYCEKRSIRTVFDIDDYLFDPNLFSHIKGAHQLSPGRQNRYIERIIHYRKLLSQCNIASCSTIYLQKAMQKINSNTVVIPNSINQTQLNIAKSIKENNRNRPSIKICYLSGSPTHQVDFEICREIVFNLLKTHPHLELHIVGHLNVVYPETIQKQIFHYSFMPYTDMLKFLATMDINIAPLEPNNPFNDAKSELKFFESALVKVPTIASPNDTFKRVIQHQHNGLLATTPNEWLTAFETLIQSREERERIADHAHHTAMSHYTENAITPTLECVYQLA